MKQVKGGDPSARLVDAIVKGIQEVKGKDIVHLDLRAIPNSACDHFIICHGDSDTQVRSITASIEKFSQRDAGEVPWHVEGLTHGEWVLLDFVDVVAHVFHRDRRAFYAVEDLWADATRQSYENVA